MILRLRCYFQKTVHSLWMDEAIRWAILVFLALRLLTGIAAVIMVHNIPVESPTWLYKNPDSQTYVLALLPDAPLHIIAEPWLRYDTAWYIHNAMQGYHPGNPSIVFPPLYPTTIRVLASLLGGNYTLASIIASNLACLIAFILLYKVVLLEFGSSALARRTLVCLAAFPTAYYLVAGYSEALFLALTLGTFLAAFNRQWWLAGLLAGLAALTRSQGAILCLPLGWIAYVQLRETGFRVLLSRVPAVVGGPIGILTYFVYLNVNHLGMPDGAYETKWQIFTRLPWEALRAFFERWSRGQTVSFENDNALALALIVVLGFIVVFRLRPAYSLYVGSALGVILLRYHNGPQFEGMVRYVLVMFPCFIIMSMILRRWWLLLPLVAVAIYWQLVLLDHFVHWKWVA